MKNADWKVKVALVLGAVLSWPVVGSLLDGTISSTSAAIRIAIAMVLAYCGVLLVATVIGGYLPEPEPDPEPATPELEGVEDAVLVDEIDAANAPDEDADAV